MNQDFRDILRALGEADSRFLDVGAYAVSVHAQTCAAGGFGIWVDPTLENAARVYGALRVFGAPLHELSERDLATPDVVFQIGLPPRRVDILTSVTSVGFPEAWPGRGDLR